MLFRSSNILLALLGAILLSLGWIYPLQFFIFISLVPLFIIEERISKQKETSKLRLIGYVYLVFLIWNLLLTWWIYFASLGGALMAVLCNSIIMTSVFMIWVNLKKRLNKSWSIWLFVPIWLGYEYGHTLWDLTWPWLTLGNAFAFMPNWIQWYEITGTSGGTLWVLIANIVIFKAIDSNIKSYKYIVKISGIILVPIVISYIFLYIRKNEYHKKDSLKSYKTLVIQPNIDPYNEKFYIEPEIQLNYLKKDLDGVLDSSYHLLILPETFLTENIFEGQEENSFSIHFLKEQILDKYPNLTIITGANTIKSYQSGEELSATARKFSDADMYYDSYNTAIQFNKNGIKYYHKSKLVPGVEKMPFPFIFKHIEQFAIDLGGTTGSLGIQNERTVFFNNSGKVAIAPVICYESVYSDYVTDYIKNGANLIAIITNDGWWENTPGHKQHLAYAKLRAIETRKEIVRCANTGISCFITSLGEIEQATKYWEKAIISKQVSTTDTQTLFVKFGDVISYLSSIIAILLVIWSQILRFKKS
jgi:apolipoprotein N-acyltransferase